VFDAWLKFGVRETPTNLYPNEKGAATLSTTKHQEVFTFLRPNYVDPGESEYSTRSRASHPDVYHDRVSTESFSYRSETISTMMRLANLRPPTLYIFGGDSYMSQPVFQEEKLRTTGSGWGGSGGIKEGRVKGVSLEGIGHLVAMDAPGLCADSAAAWIGQETKRWAKEMELYKEWTKRSLKEKSTLSEEWQRRMGGDPRKRAKGKL
jgi:pimeloyl-ACP methyl ester carboxylesterase